MKITLFGATGVIGQRILNEALNRGFAVKSVVHSNKGLPGRENLTVVEGEINDPGSVAEVSAGCDAVVSAYGPGTTNPEPREPLLSATRSLIEGAKRAGVKRLITVGGAASLEVAPGVRLLDSGHLPAEWMKIAQAHIDALDVIRASDVNWTVLCPSAIIEPGERTGQFRIAENTLVTDGKGNSKISAEDFAVALINELEHPQFERKRFTVGY